MSKILTFLEPKRRKTVLAIILLIIAGFVAKALFQFLFKTQEEVAPSFQTPVEAVTVVQESIPIQVRAFGSLVAVDSGWISSEIPGQISEILFDEGQEVEAGKVVVRLDDAIYSANLQAAEAEAKLSQVNYDRAQALFKRGAQSQEYLDTSSAELQSRLANVAVKQAELDKTRLEAPYHGRLGARHFSVGDYVASGEPLVEIVEIKRLKVDYSVPERYLSRLALNQTVDLSSSAFPGKSFTGMVDFISPSISPATRTIGLRALVPNEAGVLSPGLSIEVVHTLGIEPNALIVPEQSLVPTLEGQIVYKIVDGRAISTPIVIGSRADGRVHVISGLSAGDQIVVAGHQKIRNGSPVNIIVKTSEDVEERLDEKSLNEEESAEEESN